MFDTYKKNNGMQISKRGQQWSAELKKIITTTFVYYVRQFEIRLDKKNVQL